jgi:uncharacterized membrane protein YuzA (DUF378 family)
MDDLNLQMIVWIIAEIGALNWGLQEVADINLVTELLGGSAGVVYIIIGLAGAAALAEKAGVVDLEEL